MQIAVLVKVVAGELSPFDAAALELALRVPNATVRVLSMCPESARARLQSLTRLGVSEVILLCDPAFAGSDTLATARVLAAALQRVPHDLILCGRQTTDGDTGQVGPEVAVRLAVPCLSHTLAFALKEGLVSATTRMGEETAPLPALLTVERVADLRFPSIRSKESAITVWNCRDIGIKENQCGLRGSPTRVVHTFENNRGRRKCRFLPPSEIVKMIQDPPPRGEKFALAQSESKLPFALAVGEEVHAAASLVASRVEVLSPDTPQTLAARIREADPDAVFFAADVWGRRVAPAVAALLDCGLCADCTALETDGNTLHLFRPARGGNVLAEVVCLTRPAMATVRTETPTDRVLVAGGRGALPFLPALWAFADKLGAGRAASRALVDSAAAPYEWQVGLTGRSVCPEVYVAVGISGAVQHTCAIESAGLVVAINPDRNAPIFEYADIGFCGSFADFIKECEEI